MKLRSICVYMIIALSFIMSLHAQSHLEERHHEHSPIDAAEAELSVAEAIRLEQNERYAERQLYKQLFSDAYGAYPTLPAGILEALAFVNSRWTNVQPDPHEDPAHGPPTYGVMGLYAGDGNMADLVGEGAELLDVSREQVMRDPATNILAVAAILDTYFEQYNLKKPALENTVSALEYVSGIPADDDIGAFAVESFAYDVLFTLDRGIDEPGIEVPQRRVAWQEAFEVPALVRQKAPMVQVDLQSKRVIVPGAEIDPISETLKSTEEGEASQKKTSDYGPALWSGSPYHGARTQSVSAVTIHTIQGSYAGAISWFKNNPYSVSAHYVIRSSDGQVTQCVREYRRANHVGSENPYTIGIEHEGYVSTSSYYTTAMYNSSAALVRDICSAYGINRNTTYGGPGHTDVVLLSSSYKIKGHQHYPNQNHSDPGRYWDWARYKSLITGGSSGGGGGGSTGGGITLLDTFETGEGHFNMSPAYSGSTSGISTSSTANRTSSVAYRDNYSMHVKLVDNPNTTAPWRVRFLSGIGRPSSNVSMAKAGGNIGFWVYAGGNGMEVAVGVDDSDGTEVSSHRSIPAGQWTWVQWDLDDAAQWFTWIGGNGTINASNVTMDAIWFFRDNTSYNVNLYIDNVAYFKD